MIDYLKLLLFIVFMFWPYLLVASAAGAVAGFVSGRWFHWQADDKPRAAGCSITEGDRRANVKEADGQRPMPAGPPPGLIPSEEGSDVWVVFQIHGNGPPADWDFVGVFSSRRNAVAACRDEHYFMARWAINYAAPHERTQGMWRDGFWPRSEEIAP